ncbi:MAG: small subunit ribosomal protein, partial [Actinomycetota bacterium]|nr:small subunit ribosomal protein [Actinomycetota bacterium]
MMEAGDFAAMPKKEALILSRELEKLQRNLGGIRNLAKLPDAVFIIDTKKEHIAVTEANKLGMPIVAVVDTNCDPDLIQYVIPGNDDAIRAGNLMCRIISDAVEEGKHIASRRNAKLQAATAKPSPNAIDPELEARRMQQQAEARRQAALQAQEREARLASSRRHQPEDDAAASAPPAPPAAEVGPPAGSGPATEGGPGSEGGPAVEDSLPTDTTTDDMPSATVDALAAHGAMTAPTMIEVPTEPAPAAAPAGDGGDA